MLTIENQRYGIILAIETSCDETAAAVLAFAKSRKSSGGSSCRLLANVVSSQVKLHRKFGGVVPHLAAREHLKNIQPVLRRALREAKCSLREVDYLAVTRGPGLIPSLLIGVNFARALAFALRKPLLGVNHIEGHIYSNWLAPIGEIPSPALQTPKFPILNLVVSGGHTELILMPRHGRYRIIGQTRDDAAGEAFDKVAKLLGLGYPGGPVISQLAREGRPAAFAFPRPMLGSYNFDFSFSGLKTAVLYTASDLANTARRGRKSFRKLRVGKRHIPDLCASFEQAVVDVLAAKTIRAAKAHGAGAILLSGGVSANRKLRETLRAEVAQELPGVSYRQPDLAYTGDNAAMIAMAAYWKIATGGAGRKGGGWDWRNVEADANLRIA